MTCTDRMLRRWIATSIVAALVVSVLPGATAAQRARKPEPTHKDVSYGHLERNVLDLWLAESDEPTPLGVYIHGGGFRGGKQSSISGRVVTELLK